MKNNNTLNICRRYDFLLGFIKNYLRLRDTTIVAVFVRKNEPEQILENGIAI